MGKGIVIFIVFLLLIGILIFTYYKYEKPKKTENVIYYTNLTIFAIYQDQLVKTGYEIYTGNNTLYNKGTTDKMGGVREIVTINKTYYIRNKNLKNQSYYISEIPFFTTMIDKNNRIVLYLDKYSDLNINQEGDLSNNDKIQLILSDNDTFKDLMYCLKWSELLIFVNPLNMNNKLDDNYDDNYKCYETGQNINVKNNYTITISYGTINTLTPNDYIRVQFYDRDKILNESYIKKQEYVIK